MSSNVRAHFSLLSLHTKLLLQIVISSNVEPSVSELSSRLDDYTLKIKLGEGGYGSAWLAETVLDGERALVVIKVVNRAKAASLLSYDAVSVERELMQRISTGDRFGEFLHIIEAFDDAYNAYFVMVSNWFFFESS